MQIQDSLNNWSKFVWSEWWTPQSDFDVNKLHKVDVVENVARYITLFKIIPNEGERTSFYESFWVQATHYYREIIKSIRFFMNYLIYGF